jgi:hypothetical protein
LTMLSPSSLTELPSQRLSSTYKRDRIALALQTTPFAQLSRLARACEMWHVTRWGKLCHTQWAEVRRGSSSIRQCAHANNRGYASPWHAYARLYIHNTTCGLYKLRIVLFEHSCQLAQKDQSTSTSTHSKDGRSQGSPGILACQEHVEYVY